MYMQWLNVLFGFFKGEQGRGGDNRLSESCFAVAGGRQNRP